MKKLLSLLLCTSSFISLMATPGCKKQTQMDNNSEVVTYSDSTAKTYLALGDSYTIGQSVQTAERFPHITASILRSNGIAINEPKYVAVTGWTTAELQRGIANEKLAKQYDVVSLLIGVNDQYRGLDTAGYRERFTQLLEQAISFAGNKKTNVFVLSIPDYSATPFVHAQQKARVSKEIDEFNAINKDVTMKYKVSYVDITPATREAANDESLLASDHLHYSAKEHRVWAEMLAPLMQSVLK